MCHDSFLCAMTIWMGHLCLGKVRDPLICAMTHSYVPWLKSLLCWKHTSAVYCTHKSTLLINKLRSLLYLKVYFTENTPQQFTSEKCQCFSTSEKCYFGHFSEVFEMAFLRRKSKKWYFSEVEKHFFWGMLSQRLLRNARNGISEKFTLWVIVRSATHCNTLQHTATHCNTLQHTATHCNTLQHTYPSPETSLPSSHSSPSSACVSPASCRDVLQRVVVCCSAL